MSTRLLDLMMREGGWRADTVKGCVPFIIDNVQQYMTQDMGSHYTWDDFPNLAPPFSRYWMEYESRAPHAPTPNRTYQMQSGVGVYVARIPEDNVQCLTESAQQGPQFQEQLETFIATSDEAKWLLNFVLWDRRSDEPLQDDDPIVLIARMQVLVKADGSRASTRVAMEVFDGSFNDPLPTSLLFAGLSPFLLATSFMHCKNVERVERVAPRHERKRAKREGQLPLVTYKTLVIEPMTRVLHTEGGRGAGTNLKLAMHICRGHFKTFDEKPLFGKHRGMFFWNDQVRSKHSDRAVAKRDDVHPARDESGIAITQSRPIGED